MLRYFILYVKVEIRGLTTQHYVTPTLYYCQEVLQLLNKLFPTDRFRTSYLENRSRRMEVGSEVYTVVLTNRGRNARNVCIV